MSASSKTTTGALPPSSRWTRLSAVRRGLGDPLAGRRRAGEADHLHVGVGDQLGAGRLAVAADRVEDARRQDVRAPLGELQRRHRRRLGGLEDHRVAGGQGRADLPDRHHQRVVPGGDLADHADRLAADEGGVALHVLAGGAALQAAGRAGEEAQVVGHHRHLVLEHGAARLAGVGGLEVGDLLAALLDQVGHPQQRPGALARRRRRPAVEGLLGGRDGAVDVGLGRERRLGDRPRRSPG